MGDGTTGHDGAVSWNVGTTTDNAALVYNVFGTQAGGNIGGSGSVQNSARGPCCSPAIIPTPARRSSCAGTLQTYGPVAHYTLDNTTADATGHSSALTAVGSPGYTTGKFGQGDHAQRIKPVSYPVLHVVLGDERLHGFRVGQPLVDRQRRQPAIISTRNGGDDTFDLQYNDSKLHADIGSGGGWLNNGADYATAPSRAGT